MGCGERTGASGLPITVGDGDRALMTYEEIQKNMERMRSTLIEEII